MRIWYAILIACTFCMQSTTPSAQNYPSKPIRIVASAPGGGNELASRLLAQGLTDKLGQQVIIDGRASGVIPGEIVAKANPDGYTLLYYGSTIWLLPLMISHSP